MRLNQRPYENELHLTKWESIINYINGHRDS